MATQTFKPSPRYRGKLYLVATVPAVVIMLVGLPLYWLAGRDDGLLAAIVVIGIVLLANLVWYLPTLLLINSYSWASGRSQSNMSHFGLSLI